MTQTAIVTGASRGIGRAIAVELGRRGYRVALLARDRDGLEETAGSVAEAGSHGSVVAPVDVTDPRALGDVLASVLAEFAHSLDLLVNNAGSALRRARVEDLTDDDWRAALDLNLLAAVRTTRGCFDALRAAEGCVVNISSIVSHRTSPTGATYVAAKAALDGYTRTVAVEWARHGIRCFGVAPGYVATDFNQEMEEAGLTERFLKKVPVRSAIDPSEVARLVADLSSDEYRHVTGSVIPIDGGLHVPI